MFERSDKTINTLSDLQISSQHTLHALYNHYITDVWKGIVICRPILHFDYTYVSRHSFASARWLYRLVCEIVVPAAAVGCCRHERGSS